jgi:hypothetical protein
MCRGVISTQVPLHDVPDLDAFDLNKEGSKLSRDDFELDFLQANDEHFSWLLEDEVDKLICSSLSTRSNRGFFISANNEKKSHVESR